MGQRKSRNKKWKRCECKRSNEHVSRLHDGFICGRKNFRFPNVKRGKKRKTWLSGFRHGPYTTTYSNRKPKFSRPSCRTSKTKASQRDIPKRFLTKQIFGFRFSASLNENDRKQFNWTRSLLVEEFFGLQFLGEVGFAWNYSQICFSSSALAVQCV